MNTARKIAAAITVALTLGVVGIATAPAAQADTSWGCGGYC